MFPPALARISGPGPGFCRQPSGRRRTARYPSCRGPSQATQPGFGAWWWWHAASLTAQIQPSDHLCLQDACTVPTNPAGSALGTKGARAHSQSSRRGDCINSWCAQTGGAAGNERGRDGGRGNLKCWAPAVNSSCFCFRVINVPLNRARAWAPVSAAFNAISSPDWTGLGAAGGDLYFLPSPVNEVMRAWGLEAGHSRGDSPEPPKPRQPAPQKPLQRATHPFPLCHIY